MTQLFSDENAKPNRVDSKAHVPVWKDIAILPTALLGNPTSVHTLREELIAKHEQAAHDRSEDAARLADDGLRLLGELRALHTHHEALLTLSNCSAAQAQKLVALNEEIAGKQADYQEVRMFCDLLNHEAGLHLRAAQRLRSRM